MLPSQGAAAAVVLRGLGGPTVKSALLLLVSTQPPLLRIAAVMFDSAVVGVPSVAFVVLPKLTASTTVPPLVADAGRAVAAFESSTRPAVALNAIVPVRSAVAVTVPPAPAAWLIRKYCPGWITVPGGIAVNW